MTDRNIPPVGWHIEIQRPSGQPYRPQVTEASWMPAVNGRPSVEARVPFDPDTESRIDGLLDQTADTVALVWYDGVQLPIDRLDAATTNRERGEIRLELSGGRQMEDYLVEQFDEIASTQAMRDLIDQYTDYSRDIDDVNASTETDILFASAAGSNLTDVFGTPADTTPITIDQTNGAALEQSAWRTERDFGGVNTEVVDSTETWTEDRAARLTSGTDSVTFSTSGAGYTVPNGDVRVAIRWAWVGTDNTNPEIVISTDDETIETIAEDALLAANDRSDLEWSQYSTSSTTLSPSDDVKVTLGVSSTLNSNDGSIYVDTGWIGDGRYNYTFDDSIASLPETYPDAAELTSTQYESLQVVVGGRATTDTAVTELALSNDGAASYPLTASNASVVDGSFSTGGQSLTGRVTLGRSGTDSGESFDAYELYADLEDTPTLLERVLDEERLEDAANTVAESGDFVWELQRDAAANLDDPDGLQFAMTQTGQRKDTLDASQINIEGRKTIEEQYDRVIIEGASESFEESVTLPSSTGLAVGLANAPVVAGSETVTYQGSTLERGTDYAVSYQEGSVEALSGGTLSGGETITVSYRAKPRGQHPRDSQLGSDPRTLVRQLPEATTDRQCESLALEIYRDVKDPLVEGTIVVDDIPPGTSLIDALPADELPFGQSLVVYDSRHGGGQVALDVGSRQSVAESIAENSSQLQDVSEKL